MHLDTKQLKDFLIDSGVITRSGFSEIEGDIKKGRYKDSAEKVLVSLGKITEDDLRKAESYSFGIPFVELKGHKIDLSILSIIPEPISRKHNVIAFSRMNDSVEVAFLDVKDISSIEFLKDKGIKILPRLTDTESMRYALLQYQKHLKTEFGDFIQKNSLEEGEIIKVVEMLVKHALLQNSSDIHIECMEDKVVVRYRIAGVLHDAMILPKAAAANIVSKIRSLSNLKTTDMPQEGKLKTKIDGEELSLRVSITPTYFGEKTVMKFLKDNVGGYSFQSLGLFGENLEKVHEVISERNGMVLVAGPKGSGKTSTLYAMLESLNNPSISIGTIEDPIEYQMPRVNQMQVKEKAGLTFAHGLRSLVKQDSDVIMVGDIADSETASLSVSAALTGHFVLSAINANSALGAIQKLSQMKVEPFAAASAVKLVVSQRLVRRLSDSKQKYILSKSELGTLSKIVDMERVLKILKEENIVGQKDDWSKIHFFKPKSDNAHDAYSGKVAIHEVVRITPAIRELLVKGAGHKEIEAESKMEGNRSAIEDGMVKCAMGLTTVDEVLKSEF
ncbi:MAG: GspE/PulE family protein [Candidatus Paceibacterota bacterium]